MRGLPPYAYPSRSSLSSYPTLPLPALFAHNPPSITSQGLFQTNDWDSPIGTFIHFSTGPAILSRLVFSPSPLPLDLSLSQETHKSEHVSVLPEAGLRSEGVVTEDGSSAVEQQPTKQNAGNATQ